MIFDGSIGAGQRLNESILAARFGTSRGPLLGHAGLCLRASERFVLKRFAQVDRMSHRGI